MGIVSENKNQEAAKGNDQVTREFEIRRIYLKDLSFEAPHLPEIFGLAWDPKVSMDLETNSRKVSEGLYEVVLRVTLTVKLKEQVAFLVELKQAGVFTLKGFSSEQLGLMLGSFCPNIIFPYIRELVSETICRSGLPPLYLAPINFDALYQEQLARRTGDSSGKSNGE